MNTTVSHDAMQQPKSTALHQQERARPDRRTTGWRTFVCSLYKGRRVGPRRTVEKTAPYYTDVYDSRLLLLVLFIVLLCVADAGFTLQILAHGGRELNPLMNELLEISTRSFFIGKYVITSTALLFALVHINFKLLRLIPMRQVLCALFGFYAGLIGYELWILSSIYSPLIAG